MIHRRGESNKSDFIKIKNFCSLKDFKRIKRYTHTGRRYVQITYLIKDLHPEYINTSQNSLIRNKQPNLKK